MRRDALSVRIQKVLPQPAVGVTTAGCGVLSLIAAWAATASAPPSPAGWLLALALAGAIVAAYRFPVHVRHQTKVALVTIVYYLLAVLAPPPLAALAAGLGALAGELSRRRLSGAYPSDIASEAGRRVLIVLIGAVIAHLGAAGPTPAALLGAAVALAVLDAVSLPLVLAPVANEPPRLVLLEIMRTTALAEGMQYAVAIVGAAAAVHYPWTLPLLVVPCALVYRAFKIMKEMHDGTRQLLESMADAVDLRDSYTGGHSRRVTEYSAAILRAIGLQGPEVALIVTAARVHDIGKIGIPDAILHKPDRLTDEERAIMETHSARGADLLKRYGDFSRGVAIVRHHHESWDGSGYPDRLARAQIPFGARVIAVADSYDAMTSDRPYRRGMPVQKAAAILREGRGRQWDAAVVDAFLRTIGDESDAPAAPALHLVPETTPGAPAPVLKETA